MSYAMIGLCGDKNFISIETLRILPQLCNQEIELLMVFNTEEHPEWGAWVGACMEFLQEKRLLTVGSNICLTRRGHQVRRAIEALRT